VRITGGRWRSRPLQGPGRGKALRPTPDSLRERVFAVLGERVEDARVLDLFAGTGAIGLEALSRGASEVVFVERHRGAVRVIRANCTALDVAESACSILNLPAVRAVRFLARRRRCFDLVWIDPPFEHWRLGVEAAHAVVADGLLSEDALVCLESPATAALSDIEPPLVVERDLAGGASRVVLLRVAPGQTAGCRVQGAGSREPG